MRRKFLRSENGQLLVWVALAVPLLILFTALAVDMSLIYMNKGRLANAVDSAVLTGVRNYGNGSAQQITQAQSLATDMFEANYGSTAPSLTFEWCPNSSDPNCGQSISLTVHAEATQKTNFMQIVPKFAIWQLGDTAQATRSNLVMTIILDRSGSMCGGTIPCVGGGSGDDGGEALQAAVPAFVADFDNGVDHLGLVSFASTATTDVAMTTNFQSAIDKAVAGYTFVGGTFGGGAGTNTCAYGTACTETNGPPLNMADYQNSTVPVSPGFPVTRVVVYFTDGQMNTIQDTFACTNLGNTLYNYGGFDPSCSSGVCTPPPSTDYDFFNANNSNSNWSQTTGNDLSWFYATDSGNGSCNWGPNGGGLGLCGSNPPWNATTVCKGVTQFYSQQNGTNEPFTWTNITNETKWRALYTAGKMQGETTPTYVYVIGLGNVITGNPTTEAFLATLANDPNGPANYSGATYNSSLPAGLFLIVPNCPSSVCTQELTEAFQTIAARVLLRLSQ